MHGCLLLQIIPSLPYAMLSANNDDIPLILFVMCQSFVTFARLFFRNIR